MSKPSNTVAGTRLKRRNLVNNVRLSDLERRAELRRPKPVEPSESGIEIVAAYQQNFIGTPEQLLKLLCDVQGREPDFLEAFVRADILNTVLNYAETPETSSLLFQLANEFACSDAHCGYAFNSGVLGFAINCLHDFRTQERDLLKYALQFVLNTIDDSLTFATTVSQRLDASLLSCMLDAFKGESTMESLIVGVWFALYKAQSIALGDSMLEHVELFIAFLHSDPAQPAVQHLMRNVMGIVTMLIANNLDKPELCEQILQLLGPGELVAGLQNPNLQFIHTHILNVLVNFTSLETSDWIAQHLVDLGIDKCLQHASDRISLMLINNLMIAHPGLIPGFAKLKDFVSNVVYVGNTGSAEIKFECVGILLQLSYYGLASVADTLVYTAVNRLFADAMQLQNYPLHSNVMDALSGFIESELLRMQLPNIHKNHLEVSLLICTFLSSPTDPSSLVSQLEAYANNAKAPPELTEKADHLVNILQQYAQRIAEEQ